MSIIPRGVYTVNKLLRCLKCEIRGRGNLTQDKRGPCKPAYHVQSDRQLRKSLKTLPDYAKQLGPACFLGVEHG
jgi:hypothetical protein